MKKLVKSIIAATLCVLIAVSALGVETAQAATKKIPLKITLGGKSYTFTKDVKKLPKTINLKKVAKKWGEPSSQSEEKDDTTWSNGDSFVRCLTVEDSDPIIDTYIYDKKSSVFGITCGMTRNATIKKLKKTGFKEKNLIYDFDEYPEFLNCEYGKVRVVVRFDENGKSTSIHAIMQ